MTRGRVVQGTWADGRLYDPSTHDVSFDHLTEAAYRDPGFKAEEEQYSAKDVTKILRSAQRLAEKHGRWKLAVDLNNLASDVRTAGDEVIRQTRPYAKQVAKAQKRVEEYQTAVILKERAREKCEAHAVALEAALDDRHAIGRLIETGFHIEAEGPLPPRTRLLPADRELIRRERQKESRK